MIRVSLKMLDDKRHWDALRALDEKGQVDWKSISQYQRLSKEFIIHFAHKVHWRLICQNVYLEEDFMKMFCHYLHWPTVSIYQILSEQFIRYYQHRVIWISISRYQDLSEDFIREFQNKVDWRYISRWQKLSENFILEFEHDVDWKGIIEKQNVSSKFIAWYSAILKHNGIKVKKYKYNYKPKTMINNVEFIKIKHKSLTYGCMKFKLNDIIKENNSIKKELSLNSSDFYLIDANFD